MYKTDYTKICTKKKQAKMVEKRQRKKFHITFLQDIPIEDM